MRNFCQTILLPLIALGLSGCVAVGPDYAPPASAAARLPASFRLPAGLDPGSAEVMWWRSFGDPVLVTLVERALAANHDVAIAVARLDESRAILGETRQNFMPSAQVAFGHEKRRRSEVETAPGQARQTDTYRGAIDASWEIDLFGRVRRSVQAAQAQVGSREALLHGVQAAVAAAVAAAWFELCGAEAELVVAAEISGRQRASLGLIERMAGAGAASEFDRLRVEAALRNAEAVVPELQRRLAASRNALAVLLGETPQTFALPAAAPLSGTLAVRTIAVGDPAALLRRRADIAAAERQLAAAAARIGIETAALYPDIQVQGSIGFVAGSLDALGERGTQASLIGPVIRWNLLDRGRARARIAASEARTREALLTYDQTVLRALQETDDAFKAYEAAGSVLERRLLESAASREAARLARLQFSAGEGIYLDVLEAERSDFTSRRALAAARTDHQLALVGIYKALGGGWEVCALANQDCSGAGAVPAASAATLLSDRP